MYFVHFMFSEICTTIFPKVILEYVAFTNFMLIWD
jgi:hypothetical protein